jgi:hypothetical protein
MKVNSLILRSMKPPFFVQQAHIRGAKPTYNTEVFGIQWCVDLSLLLDIVKRNGQSYNYTLNIRCNYQKNESGSIVGWGSAFKLQKLFTVTDIEGALNDDGTIPEDLLEQLIGKSIFVLSYISGVREKESLRYQMWDVVEKDRQSIISEFESSLQKGYPRNYAPEVRTIIREDEIVSSADTAANKSNESNELIF